MAKDREPQSEYEQDDERDEMEAVDAEKAEEEEDEPEFEQPFCPRCGWHNTRPSHTSNVLDMVVRVFGLRPYRCRSCGNRFRCMRRIKRAS
jgi:predicted Zn-ribbon and HTH transcriptional regulator